MVEMSLTFDQTRRREKNQITFFQFLSGCLSFRVTFNLSFSKGRKEKLTTRVNQLEDIVVKKISPITIIIRPILFYDPLQRRKILFENDSKRNKR